MKKVSVNAYSVADGHVLRGTEKIAGYTDGKLDFLPGKDQYRAPVVRFLRENNLPANVTPLPPAAQPNTVARKVSAVPVPDVIAVGAVGASIVPQLPGGGAADGSPQLPPEKSIAVTLHTPAAIRTQKDVKALPINPLKARDYLEEGAPPMTKEQGDKTPAFVAWLRANHPGDAAKRYANRVVNG